MAKNDVISIATIGVGVGVLVLWLEGGFEPFWNALKAGMSGGSPGGSSDNPPIEGEENNGDNGSNADENSPAPINCMSGATLARNSGAGWRCIPNEDILIPEAGQGCTSDMYPFSGEIYERGSGEVKRACFTAKSIQSGGDNSPATDISPLGIFRGTADTGVPYNV